VSEYHARNGFLTSKGLEEAAQREDALGTGPWVDNEECVLYLDLPVSVSGLRRDEDMYDQITEEEIDEQARRFHRGS